MIHRLKNLGDTLGQWMYNNTYCPTCKATGYSAHHKDCKDEKVEISSTARFPKKNASKKVWDKFYDKFVLQLELKEFLEKRKKETKIFKEKSKLKDKEIKSLKTSKTSSK